MSRMSRVQFNLLPDVKLEYIKATYRRRIISIVCFLVGGVFLVLFIFMFLLVRVNQPKHLSNLNEDIKSNVAELQSNKDLDKILTIQNQLNSLPDLHNKKVMASRLFDYLTQVTPANASISNVEVDYEAKTIKIKGDADSITTVNKFADTLKFTDYEKTSNGSDAKKDKAFSSVVLDNFSINSQQGSTANNANKSVSYAMNFAYNEAIFADYAKDSNPLNNDVKLVVPKVITTRSETEKPESLFDKKIEPTPTPNQNGGQN